MFPRRRFVALAAATLALSASAVPAQPPRVQAYEGAAKIGNLERITVVYPAKEGLEGRVLHDNALLKASYLIERYGTQAEVTADDAVTDEQRRDNLLVLGWDNALTRDAWFGQVVRREGDRVYFLGAAANRNDDLLWMHSNPYNPDRFLVFWSRLDADRDRSLPFPFIGSDWAWYRDYFILHQGNFTAAMEWPPTRELLAEHDRPIRAIPVAATSAHYRLHHRPDTLDDAARAKILEVREAALSRAAELLGVEIPQDYVVDLFVYRDADTKHELTGVSDPVHTLPTRRELHMIAGHARRDFVQEEIHLMAGDAWGLCHAAGMYQGLAIYLQADPRGQGAYAALLVEQDRIPRVAELYADEKLRKLVAAGYGFPAAALMVEWIAARGGRPAIAAAYGLLRSEATERLAAILELGEADAVEAAFADWMRERAAGSVDDLAFRRAYDTSRERARVGDTLGQIAALKQALEVRPHDASLAYQLALIELEFGETDAARARFERLVALPAPIEPAWVAPFSRLKLAGLLAEAGDAKGARRLYREVLAGPNEHDAHRHASEALAALGNG